MRHVDIHFNGSRRLALNNISLRIKSGDRIGIVGKNGAGKSTLLRTIAAIYPPSHGVVAVEGRISSLFHLGLGMQIEESGYKNIVLNGLLAGFTRQEINNAIDDIAAFSELGEQLYQPIRTYSQGMAMRLKFACATSFEPEILLLDEWMGAGDEEFQKKASIRMDNLVNSANIILFASHNIPLMQKICNFALWLDEGEMLMFDKIETVLAARRQQIASQTPHP